ncbi:Putative MATH and UCH domain protein, putaitve (AFU_orthologue; AFUA_5G01750) [Aspergillus calidoustus]|uniref:Putative MATH and UCH domain protein, putaitve (AFU_orthologue AFUA_5G01750) n=1 Tax=Aspergillus calidoustus TaxID=454130 RepID=A0A0U5GU52_ASPCI|nr:Putative MATH and UCH domain protein, putaitve (AFU_orthologue; AFUA_5G01750) [Aspergillus calidoustus]
MRSPPAFVGGYWWTIKFFPRGNNVGSLSAYIECSSTPPKPDSTLPETEFKVLRGPADAKLDASTPDLDMKFARTEDPDAWSEAFKSQYPAAANASEAATPETWRVSAQIGVIVYNPDEPRTGFMQSSCHQFNPHNLDWGWTNFHGPWDQIHRRQRGQHQALLRNDTLAFDAYIQIFDDPTRSLWWHPSDAEQTWDSLGLTGYRPLGDSVINHSADVAGLATWLHIAPFCKIIQNANVLEHLSNCDVKPKPLCDALQKFLWKLRQRSQSLDFVDTDNITTTLRNLHEGSSDVCEFWERLRRSLELELAGTNAVKELAELFDSPSLDSLQPGDTQQDTIHTIPKDFNSRIFVPADQAKTTAEAFNWYLGAKPGKWALPPVLHLELGRQTLDKVARQWRLLYNRVDLDEELDLSQHLVEGQSGKYVLYGYIVHRGRRTSGKFFSILRPGGPGTKWLAFDDGSDNRVECLTRKTALGPHLGLEDTETPDHKTGHDVAIAVMYIRSDVVKDYLPGPQGPWEVSEELKEYYETGRVSLPKKTDDGNAEEEDVQVEVYSLQKHDQLPSLFDTYDLMSQAKAANSVMYLSVPRSTNLADVRKKIATWATARAETGVSPENVRLWQIGHTRDRYGPTLAFIRISDLTATLDIPHNPVRYWLQIVSDADAKYFAMNDPAPVVVNTKPEEAVVEQAASETSDDAQVIPTSESAEPSSSRVALQEPPIAESTDPAPMSTEPSSTPSSNNEATENSAQAVVETAQIEVLLESAESAEATVVVSNAIPSSVSTDTASAVEPTVEATESPTQAPEVSAQSEVQATSVQQEAIASSEDRAVTTATNPVAVSIGNSDNATAEGASEVPDNTNSSDSAPPDETASDENDAVIAAIIAGDLQQLEEAQENQSSDTPAQESEATQTSTTEGQNNASAEDNEPEAPVEPEVVLPVDHVYYYIQLFDIETQTLKVVGSFFSQKEETIKSAIRKHLEWPATKDFQVWQRIDGTTVITLASAETFDISPPDGTCFIVGDKLNKEKRAKLNEAGLFANPDPLVRYIWAASRNHPVQAFTGTKTIDATFTSDYYSGEIMKGYYHGKGKHISDNAATYTGDYVFSKKHGKGLMEYPIGDTYDGDWFENQCHGQGTFIERKTGNKYVGGYKDGKRHGKGISYWEVADEEMDLCQICFGEEQDALFYDCGHVCACVTCARQVDICPICRKNILNVVKIFRT